MARSTNTAPKLEIEEKDDKIELTLTKPGKSATPPNNIFPFKKKRNATRLGSTVMDENEADVGAKHKTKTDLMGMKKDELEDRNEEIAREKNREFDAEAHNDAVLHEKNNREETIKPGSLDEEEEHNTGGPIPSEDYGNVGGEENGKKSPNSNPLNPENDQQEDKKPKENTDNNKDNQNENAPTSNINSEQEQARNAKNRGDSDEGDSDSSPTPSDASENSKNKDTKTEQGSSVNSEKAQAQNEQAKEEKEKNPVEEVGKKMGKKLLWSAAKKWVWGLILSAISAIGSVFLAILPVVLIIIISLIIIQLLKHPVSSGYNIWAENYGDLINTIFDI